MKILSENCFRTVGGTVLSGVRLGFVLVLAYSGLFAIYAIVRSSWQIAAILTPGAGLLGTLVANAFALLVSITTFALLFGIGAALVQSLTLLLVQGVAALINPDQRPALMAWIGFIVATLLAVAIQLAVRQGLGSYFAALWPSGYLFWLGHPSLLFMGATTWVSWRWANHAPSYRTTLAEATA